jgi:hypothetical protein
MLLKLKVYQAKAGIRQASYDHLKTKFLIS